MERRSNSSSLCHSCRIFGAAAPASGGTARMIRAMNPLFPAILRRTLDRSQKRFRRSRPGSILILVVALLVLMALIATAWMSTVRMDVYTAAQNSVNTQIDLLLDGVK